MATKNSTNNTSQTNTTMEDLLASLSAKTIAIHRGQEITGEIVLLGHNEITVDLDSKSEGVIPNKDFSATQLSGLKVGDKIKAYIVETESDSGQIVLSLFNQPAKAPVMRGGRSSFNQKQQSLWNKFVQSMNRNSKLNGKVIEINKGGLIVEVDGVRGFLPSSQIGLTSLSTMEGASGELSELVGQDLEVYVIEVDQQSNRLIFSQRGQVNEETKAKLAQYKSGQKVSGKIAAVLPFGLLVELADKTEGVVFTAEVSWDRVENLSDLFKIGKAVEAAVLSVDESYGRLNLSLKQLTEDPFTKLAESFETEDTVKGSVIGTSDQGVAIKLDNGVEAFLPATKMEQGVTYKVGEAVKMQIDSVDKNKRRVNLTPIITTTTGLIYK